MTTLQNQDPYSMLIGGHLRPAREGGRLTSTNPATGRPLASFPAATATDAIAAVDAAHNAAPGWAALAPLQRAGYVQDLATALAAHAEEFAVLDSDDNGSLLSEMRKDVTGGIAALRYFAGLALHTRGTTLPSPAGELTYSTRVPFGVVVRIVPFNHPFLFATSKIAAPLVAGNTVVLKPSEDTSLSALRIAQIAQQILPPGVLNVVTGGGREVGEALVSDRRVRRVAFTGSVATGIAIQQRASTGGVKSVTLELGGKNPLVVYPDAPLEDVVDAAVRGMNFTWQGQSCGSLSRNLVHRDVYPEFVDLLTERVGALRPGMPQDPTAQTGAIVTERQLQKVLNYVRVGQDEGSRLTTGGTRVTDDALADGLFVRPAVFADVDPRSRLSREEIFGPVLAVTPFSDENEAVRLANDSQFGLTASVFTQDLGRAHRFAAAVEAGYVWVNEVSRHVPGSLYGGVKDSGVGREEDLDELLSYTQLKNVHIKHTTTAASSPVPR